MRKRNCDKLFDNIFWYTLYLLPVILVIGMVFFVYHDTGTMPTPIQFLELLGGNGSGDFFMDIFSESLIGLASEYFFRDYTNLPFTICVLCMGHFVTIYIFHLFVDFLLFIPRLCHKWMNTLTQGD